VYKTNTLNSNWLMFRMQVLNSANIAQLGKVFRTPEKIKAEIQKYNDKINIFHVKVFNTNNCCIMVDSVTDVNTLYT